MKKIEIPEFIFENLIHNCDFSRWFKNIENKYLVDKSDLVEVYAHNELKYDPLEWIVDCEGVYNKKAYLIKSSIELIKQDTAEAVLKDLVRADEDYQYTEHLSKELYNRAKAILDSKK